MIISLDHLLDWKLYGMSMYILYTYLNVAFVLQDHREEFLVIFWFISFSYFASFDSTLLTQQKNNCLIKQIKIKTYWNGRL